MDKLILKQPLFLCGMMGSGKSTVGKLIASKLKIPFHELDSMIINAAGMSIPQIFEQKGEVWFRDLERKLLIRESQKLTGILALGGGSLQDQQVVNHLKKIGRLIFLNVPESVILKRVAGDANRPMLKSGNQNREQLEKRISILIEQRKPLYSQAQIIINAGEDSPEKIVEKIIDKIQFL